MKVHELIEALQALPEYLKEYDVYAEYGGGLRTRRLRTSEHFHLFFKESSTSEILLELLPQCHRFDGPKYKRPSAI